METLESLRRLYDQPLLPLLTRARSVHVVHHPENEIQRCELVNIKAGGCSEDCRYCAQSLRYATGITRQGILDPSSLRRAAREARLRGATRLCLGAAWRGLKEGDSRLHEVCRLVETIRDEGLEICVTLGLLRPAAARRLREAGVTVYNHNLNSGPKFYREIATTHSFADRIATLRAAQEAGLRLCSGGILGMGESVDDRLEMLLALLEFDPAPESVPLNLLVPIPGTPLSSQPPVDPLDLVRLICVTRIVLPRSRIRLAAGRRRLPPETQLLCFLAGANSIFIGEKLLTTPNASFDSDRVLFESLGVSSSGSNSCPRSKSAEPLLRRNPCRGSNFAGSVDQRGD
ncbi:Biotin synthase [Methylacidimicrobium sp. AP8]|uniref:biotin synthase BioB n=1 Tax=Methylacidimicrobium sp. AP8 TaxID=2730359 RepID=UPI0018BF9DB2|nr:biotin synthase BioB [Methylacidimicrobium sp. AP8]CAB4243494.1 Biotin synthase [Methylacidimicrobium sp. AP8]